MMAIHSVNVKIVTRSRRPMTGEPDAVAAAVIGPNARMSTTDATE